MPDDGEARLDAHLRQQLDHEGRPEERERDFFQLVRDTFARFEQQIVRSGNRRGRISEPENNETQLGILVLPSEGSVPEFSYYVKVDRDGIVEEEVFGRGSDGRLHRQLPRRLNLNGPSDISAITQDVLFQRLSDHYINRAELPLA